MSKMAKTLSKLLSWIKFMIVELFATFVGGLRTKARLTSTRSGLGATFLLIGLCVTAPAQTDSLGFNEVITATSITSPTTTKPQLFDQNIDLFSGKLRLTIPLLSMPGRGTSGINIAAVIQPQQIGGSGTYGTYNNQYGSLYVPQIYASTTSKKVYYEKLARFGSLYGPGVVYTNWQSYNYPVNANGNSVPWDGPSRRPGHLTFVDASGKQYTLRDDEIIREARYCGLTGAGTNMYAGNAFQYRNIAQAGKIYRSIEDSGIIFVADSILSVPTTDPWSGDIKYNQQDVPQLPTGYLFLRDGTRMRVSGGYIVWQRDRNGNTVFYNYELAPGNSGFTNLPGLYRVNHIKDSLNREVTITYGDNQTPDIIYFKGVGNDQRMVKVQRTKLENALQTGDYIKHLKDLYPGQHSQLTNYASYGTPFNPEIISSIEFPDGRTRTFEYNSYSEIVRLRSPDGSRSEYQYGAGAKDTLIGGAEAQAYSYVEYDQNGQPMYITQDYWLYYRRLMEVREYLDDNTLLNKKNN